jgi:hypothetical protein
MAKKGKKKGKGRARPPLRPAGAAPSGSGAARSGVSLGTPTRSVSQARVGGDQALVRSVEMSLGARNQVVKGRGGRFVVESADPSIPLDRVPYFTRDLVRLAVVGVAMLVLLAVGSVTVTQLFK